MEQVAKKPLSPAIFIVILIAIIAAFWALRSCIPGGGNVCNATVEIQAGQGAEGAVPGTISVKRGQTICWTNKDSVDHDIVFQDSPGKNPGAPDRLTVKANGGKVQIKVDGQKAAGGYEYHISPSANAGGITPPGEPEVIVE